MAHGTDLQRSQSTSFHFEDWPLKTDLPDFGSRVVAIVRRNPSAASSSFTLPGHGCQPRASAGNAPLCPGRDTRQSPTVSTVGMRSRRTTESRQGRQKPAKAGASWQLMRRHSARFCRPYRGCDPRATRGHTTEAVDDCRGSLPGQCVDTPPELADEAPNHPPRVGRAHLARPCFWFPSSAWEPLSPKLRFTA